MRVYTTWYGNGDIGTYGYNIIQTAGWLLGVVSASIILYISLAKLRGVNTRLLERRRLKLTFLLCTSLLFSFYYNTPSLVYHYPICTFNLYELQVCTSLDSNDISNVLPVTRKRISGKFMARRDRIPLCTWLSCLRIIMEKKRIIFTSLMISLVYPVASARLTLIKS